MDVIEALVAPTGGVVAGVSGDRIALRRERSRARRAQQREAGQAYTAALRRIRGLFHDSQHRQLASRDWADGILCLSDVQDTFEHRLPDGWGHLMWSIRGAAGEFVGVPALADLDDSAVTGPIAEHDEL